MHEICQFQYYFFAIHQLFEAIKYACYDFILTLVNA